MTASESGFGVRLAAAMDRHGPLCVGIDPHPELLASWGLGDDVPGLKAFSENVLEAVTGRVGIIKPQVAFFERLGPAGLQVLADLQQSARREGLLVISDAKRGDIGSTMAGYAQAWLDPRGDFATDALTVSPYLGFGSLRPAMEAALEHQSGLFVLALTSNPEGREVQLARGERGAVAADIAAQAAAENVSAGLSPGALGHVGLVIGATTAQLAAELGMDLTAGGMPLLAPGYGAQGATVEDLRVGFGAARGQVVVNSSRSILQAGPDPDTLVTAIDLARGELSC